MMSLMGSDLFMKSYNGWSLEKRVMPERPHLLFILTEFSFFLEGSFVPFV
jgi:hypothetical protein